MLNLVGITEKLEIVASVAGSLDWVSSWADWDTSTQSGKNPDGDGGNLAAASSVAVVTGHATDTRNPLYLNVRNVHATLSNTVTARAIIGGGTRELFKAPLAVGESITMSDAGVFFTYDSSGGVKSSGSAGSVDPKTNDFRITGVTGTPVMTADSTTLSTVYLSSWKGNRIALYDGANWQIVAPSAEPSLAVTGRTTDLPFDVFAFLSAGVVTLEFLNWTSATARATALARLDGVWTKSGDSTRRYLGSIRARSATSYHWVTAGDDLPCKFDLWNVDNRVDVQFRLRSLTNTWAYTLATWRQAQGSVNYQVDVMAGLQEESFNAQLLASSRNSTISIPRHVGIGYDSTTAFTGTTCATANEVASIEASQQASIGHQPAIGRHFYSWLEISTATGTCTWVGDDGALRLQSGLTGFWTC